MGTEFFKRQLRVLHLEDNEVDHILVVELLRSNGLYCEFSVARDRMEFSQALNDGRYDLIISDYSLPSFDGQQALTVAQRTQPETPFIFFSGTIGEEIAVESLKQGATDYILKQRPTRLVSAVRRALEASAEHARLKRAETALQQSEERFRIVCRATNDVIWEWDVQANRIVFSENFQSVFGHKIGEAGLAPDAFFEFIHPEDRRQITAGISALLASGGRVWWSEYRLRRADGAYAFVFDRASIMYDAAFRPLRMVGVTIDMSERKQSEQKIREQAELLDKAHDAIVVLSMDELVSFWNKGAEKLCGWTSEESLGKRFTDLVFDGNTSPRFQEILRVSEEENEWSGEIELFNKTRKKLIFQSRCTLIRNEQGEPISRLFISADITERKELEDQFIRAQRLEGMGVLVGGVAHDLNNCLAPIPVGVMLLRDEPLSPEGLSVLDTMENSIHRGIEMVRQVLTFARGGNSAKVRIQPASLLREMAKIVTDTFPKNIQCRVHIPAVPGFILGMPSQLHQVLLNLCVNARDAMPEGGSLTLSAEDVSIDAATAGKYNDIRPGAFVCITVADTGHGIAPENLPKIFQPFFTTKAPDKGTGIGLSSSQTIVHNHAGFMAVESELNRGARFKVYLPLETTATTADPKGKKPLPVGNGQRILVVDDEESILAIERTTLENFGYIVLTAKNGAEAFSRYETVAGSIDLIITDLAMPLMDGNELIASLRRKNPAVKAVIISATPEKGNKLRETVRADAFVSKPFTTEKLLTTIHSLLMPDKH
jgi:PAS domain S-box-containing protein